MNGDTPDAVPSDDFPFLGPAVSPRRREASPSADEGGELPGPFVGGVFGDRAGPGDADAARHDEAERPIAYEASDDPAAEHEAGVPAEAEGGETLPASDWAEDDLPWLRPAETIAGEPEEEAEPWRATAEIDDVVADDREVEHFSWIGAPSPEPAAPAPEAQPGEDETGAFAGAEAEEEPWYRLPAEPASTGGYEEAEEADVGAFEANAGSPEASVEDERAGFVVDEESADGGWAGAAEWETAGTGGSELSHAVEEAEVREPPASGFSWEEEEAAGEGAGAGEWVGDEGFRVEGEGEEEPVARAEAETGWEPEPVAQESAPVDTTPLPVGEWEEAPPSEESGVAAGSAGVSRSSAPSDPLVEVAERLERIAQSLRSGRAVQALEEEDPLQLLITGYALGYARARRGEG